jgi:hypothetical protein
MLTGSVMDGASAFGQAQRRVNGNEVRLCLMDRLQDVVITERDVRVSPQATQETDTCRPAGRTGQV